MAASATTLPLLHASRIAAAQVAVEKVDEDEGLLASDF